MEPRKVLLVSSDRHLLDRIPGILQGRPDGYPVVPVTRVVDALQLIERDPYHSVVCVVEQPDDLACVIRLKKARPDIPVVTLASSPDPMLRDLARQVGADAVVAKSSRVERTAEMLAMAIRTKQSAAGTRRAVAAVGEPTGDLRKLSDRSRELVQSVMGLAASAQTGDFVTLVVEDNPSDLQLLVRALGKAGLPPILRNVRNVTQAMDYLTGNGPYADREAHPFPSLIISDLHLGLQRGMDLLRWIRSQRTMSHLGFVLFTSSESPRDMEEAARLKVNFYIVKSLRPDELVSVVKSVYDHARRYKSL